MPRKGKRERIAKNIYKDSGGFEVRVVVGGVPYSDRMPLDSTLAELKRTRADLESRGRTETPREQRGTLRADTPIYLRMVQHLATAKDIAGHMAAWNAELGSIQRHRITDRDVLTVRNRWLAAGIKPKTCNNRLQTLRNLYRRLDGRRAVSPCDEIDPLPVPKTPIVRVSNDLILTVDRNLQAHERDGNHGVLKTGKTRARFRVFVSTGKRPCEIMRAQPGDVNLEARVWIPRDAKGGFCPGVYLNDDQLEAWKLFIAADAWGPYNHAAFARVLRNASWPAHVRLYQARHTLGMALSEAGVDLADVGAVLGHRPGSRVTRDRYVPVLNSRLQRASEVVEGRFQGWPVVPESAPARKRGPRKRLRDRG